MNETRQGSGFRFQIGRVACWLLAYPISLEIKEIMASYHTVKVKKIHPEAIIPRRATRGSSCYDVYSAETRTLNPKEVYAFPTGLILEVPNGYFLDIRPRSGLSMSGIVIINSPGTLDSDYRGKLKILLYNSNSILPWVIGKGDRIAQIRLGETLPVDFKETEESSETERGSRGFGSSGR